MGGPKKRIRYQYDAVGNRSALIDHDGGRFTYSYDSVSRITQVQNPQRDRTSYSYDGAGRRTVKKLSNGTRASFTYDSSWAVLVRQRPAVASRSPPPDVHGGAAETMRCSTAC
jgi:YD repeat-containing protein